MTTKILCATDGSHSSDKAVAFAVALAKSLRVPLTFLTIHGVSTDTAAGSAFWDAIEVNAVDAQVHGELHAANAKARAAGLTDITCVATSGRNIGAAIIDYAEKHGYDHIVTGSVGRTGVARLLLGSVASDVVAKAHCPVTVVR